MKVLMIAVLARARSTLVAGSLLITGPLLVAGLMMGFASTTVADTVIVTEPWVKLRTQPDPGAKAVGLVYGNDRLELLERGSGWYRIATGKGQKGWIPTTTAYEVIASIARKAFAVADSMRTTGRTQEARAGFFEIMIRYPGTVQSYESVRYLLSYYPVGSLPPLEDGRIPAGTAAEIDRVAPLLFIFEGKQLLQEGQYAQARAMFEQARVSGVVNFSAMDGIREALQQELQLALAAEDVEQITRLQLTLQGYFPDVELPYTFRYINPRTGRRVGASPPEPPPPAGPPPNPPLLNESGDGPPALNQGDQPLEDASRDKSASNITPPREGAAQANKVGSDQVALREVNSPTDPIPTDTVGEIPQESPRKLSSEPDREIAREGTRELSQENSHARSPERSTGPHTRVDAVPNAPRNLPPGDEFQEGPGSQTQAWNSSGREATSATGRTAPFSETPSMATTAVVDAPGKGTMPPLPPPAVALEALAERPPAVPPRP